MKEKMKTNKREQGITLIALVVTIIILLILAGVAINMALGDNGLFKKSKEAVNTWKSAEENETGALDYLDREWDNLINGGTGNSPISDKTTIVKIGDEEVAVPGGFTIVGAEDPTAGQTVADGIVVKDPQGNEWVWVPCYVSGGKGSNIEGRIKYDRYAFSRTEPTWNYSQTKLNETDADGSYKIVKANDTSYYFHEALSTTSAEYQSIKKYGGYYIGRYETGDKESTEAKIMRGEEGSAINTVEGDVTHTVTIKKNQAPYNYVTQAQSVTLSEGMTSTDGSNKNKLNGTQVFTKLCSSYSWDTALKFIEKTHTTYGSDSKTNAGTLVDVITDNGSNNTLANTGSKGSVCSIYDMGGNVYEYTTESSTYGSYEYVFRGGIYNGDTSTYPTGYRYCISGYANGLNGFRPTLFVK